MPDIRPMEPEDVDACEQMWHRTLAQLRRSIHLPALEVTPARAARMQARLHHLRGTDPDGSWVAEEGGQVVGVAQSLVREGLWVLSLLGVAVDAQSSGLGRRLLDAALRNGDGLPGLILCSHDPRAMRVYTQAGFTLHPAVAGVGEVAAGALGPVPVSPVTPLPPHLDVALDLVDEVDRATRGASRRPDVAHLLGAAPELREAGADQQPADPQPPELLAHDERRGYVLADRSGPLLLAAEDETAATDLLSAALSWACTRASAGDDAADATRPAAAAAAGAGGAGGAGRGATSGDDVQVSWLTARQPWAVDACLRAGLRLHPSGPVMVRGLPGLPVPFLASGAYG